MAFAVTMYTVNKRENSTAHPAAGSGATFPCVLKKGCGILSPVIQLDIGLIEDPAQYNFAFIKTFERYYWIDEWINEGPLWSASLRVDPLASWRSYIGNSSLYVLRAAAAYDGAILDGKYPAKTGCLAYEDSVGSPWCDGQSENINIGGGTFVCGIVTEAGKYGSISYYAFTRSGLSTLCSKLLDTDTLGDLGFSANDASLELQKSLINPLDYIKSCVWFPILPAIFGTILSQPISINGWSINCQQSEVTTEPPYITRNISFNLRKHPMTAARGNYVNSAPYTRITLDAPPFPLIEVDTTLTADANNINVDFTLDLITGGCIARVKADNNGIMSKVSAQVGVPIQLSQITQDFIGAATAVAQGVGGVQWWDPVGSVGRAAAAIGDTVKAQAPKLTSSGSTGGFSNLRGRARMHTQFFIPVADDPDHNGRPLCQIRRLSGLPGYQLIQDGDISAPATGPELQSIKEYLESGYYYE